MDQIQAAEGRVKCGVCFTVFGALAHQLEEPDEAAPTTLIDVQESAAFAIPEAAPPRGPRMSLFDDPGDLELPRMALRSREEPAEPPTFDAWPTRRPPPIPLDEDEPSAQQATPIALFPADEPAGRTSAWLWGAVGALLTLILVWQVLWFRGAELLLRYPAARPPLARVCDVLGCRLPIRRAPEAVRLVSRDVRPHPSVPDGLLVNVTLVNEAPVGQPFPVIQLSLFDVGGKVLGARRFEPEEYLDASVKLEEGMKPGVPVHVVLELANTQKTPVSFEFKFL
jgi:hypothetical protein